MTNFSFFKTLKRSIKFFGVKSAIWCVVMIINSLAAIVLSILTPFFLKQLTDKINADTFTDLMLKDVVRLAITIITFYLAKFFLCDIPFVCISSSLDQSNGAKMRKSLFNKLSTIKSDYFNKNTSGKTLTTFVHDTNNIATSYFGAICQLFSSVFYLIGIVVAMYLMDWRLATLCIVAIPLISTFLPLIIKKSKKIYISRRKDLGEVNANINEMFNNVLLVRANCKEDIATRDFDNLSHKLYKTSRLSSFVSGLTSPMFSFVNNLIIVLVVIFSTILVTTGIDPKGHSIAAVPSFLVFIQMFNLPFQTFSGNFQTLLNSTTSMSKVFAFLDEEDESNTGIKQLDYSDLAIHFDKVNFSYEPNKKIIDDFTLNIPYGTKVAIVGHTGSGKTTITNLLMRFYDVNSGSISIGDIDIREIKIQDLRKHISLVLQEPWIFNGTIKDNIVYNNKNITNAQLEEICDKINILHFIRTLPKGFDAEIDDNTDLSFGEKQLITIARQLASDSKFVIFDEATSNVDIQTEIKIQKAIETLTKEKTTITIAHRLSTIINSDLIIVMKNGKIVEKGSHKELLKKKGTYSSLYNSQFA